MALTNREKQARLRAKRKSDVQAYLSFKKKDGERKAKARAAMKQKMSEKEYEEYRASESARIRNYRRTKGESDQTETEQQAAPLPYKTKQGVGKAMKRARSSLPKSPIKRRIIAAGLAKEAGLLVSPVSASK